jgi:predicted nucleic acid-binding Zn ribbon protein
MSRNLVIYYSRRGQNYFGGNIVDIEKGNAEKITEFICKATGADAFEVRTVKEYSKDYMKCTEEAQEELERKVSRIEPVMVLTTALLVGMILLVVMLPLMDIMSVIG